MLNEQYVLNMDKIITSHPICPPPPIILASSGRPADVLIHPWNQNRDPCSECHGGMSMECFHYPEECHKQGAKAKSQCNFEVSPNQIGTQRKSGIWKI
jgi:hypothetical protein